MGRRVGRLMHGIIYSFSVYKQWYRVVVCRGQLVRCGDISDFEKEVISEVYLYNIITHNEGIYMCSRITIIYYTS